MKAKPPFSGARGKIVAWFVDAFESYGALLDAAMIASLAASAVLIIYALLRA